jgi:PE family
MESMSHDPVAGDIGSQLIEIALQGLDSGASAMMSLTSLIPAGAEEVSLQAALSFATEAGQVLASNTAAQQELMQTGQALMNIAKMYSQVDDTAASTLGFNAARPLLSQVTNMAGNLSNHPLAGGTGATLGAGLARAEALPGAAGTSARTPLMAGLIEPGVVGSTAPSVANAASSALGTGTAPLSSMGGAGAAAGGSSKAGLASSIEPEQDQNEDPGETYPGQRTL